MLKFEKELTSVSEVPTLLVSIKLPAQLSIHISSVFSSLSFRFFFKYRRCDKKISIGANCAGFL